VKTFVRQCDGSIYGCVTDNAVTNTEEYQMTWQTSRFLSTTAVPLCLPRAQLTQVCKSRLRKNCGKKSDYVNRKKKCNLQKHCNKNL